MKPQVWTKDDIKTLLQTNDMAVEKGILRLYSLQTEEERAAGATVVYNGMGFNGVDATFLTSIAQWLLAGKKLTKSQLHHSRRKILKYSGQLAKLAQAGSKQSYNYHVQAGAADGH